MKRNRTNYIRKTCLILVTSTLLLFFQNCAPVHEDSIATEEQISNDGDNAVDFQCNPGEQKKGQDLERLTSRQLEKSISQLFRFLDSTEKESLMALFSESLKSGQPISSIKRNAPFLSNTVFLSYLSTFEKISQFMTEDSGRLLRLLQFYINKKPGACVLNNLSQFNNNCKWAFTTNLGLHTYRRPLELSDKFLLESEFDSQSELKSSVSFVLFRLLMSPNFLFRLEDKGELISPNQLKLTGYELASRLSFHFWDSMPDDHLLEGAVSGSILTDTGYKDLVDYAVEKSKAQTTLQTFYKGWLGTDVLPSFESDTPEFTHLANGIPFNFLMQQAMGDEVRNLTDHYTWDTEGGSFADLFNTNLVFTRHRPLLDAYSYSYENLDNFPSGEFNENYRLAATERAGLLTRAALLISGNHEKDPIHRGLGIMKKFLCEDVGMVPEEVAEEIEMAGPPKLDANITTRERVHNQTSSQACATCHSRINPHGFALSGFDALGQFSPRESKFASDGSFVRTLPTNSKVEYPRFYNNFNTVETPIELSQKIGNSLNAQKCFAKKYYEFTYGNKPDEYVDGCALKSVTAKIKGDLKGTFKSLVLEESFKIRETGGAL